MPRRDDFDDEETLLQKLLRRDGMSPMPQSMARTLMVVAAVGIMAVVVIIGWATWPDKNGRVDEASLPVMRADETAYKVKPDEPGGVAIPNKDSTIFNALNTTAATGENGKTIENLLDETEEPVSKNEVLAAGDPSPPDHEVEKIEPSANAAPPPSESLSDPNDDNKMADQGNAVAQDTQDSQAAPPALQDHKAKNIIDELKAESASPETQKVETQKAGAQKTQAQKTETQKTAQKPSQPPLTQLAMNKAAPPVKTTPPSSAVSASTGNQGASYVQFAAVKSDADARANWAKLQGKYPALKSLTLRVQKVDLGAKGVFYRVQGGPVAASNAQSICGQVKQGGGQCIVIR